MNRVIPRSTGRKLCGSAAWRATCRTAEWPHHRRSPGDRTSRRLSSGWSLPGVCWCWLAPPSGRCQDAWQRDRGQRPIGCQETTTLTIQRLSKVGRGQTNVITFLFFHCAHRGTLTTKQLLLSNLISIYDSIYLCIFYFFVTSCSVVFSSNYSLERRCTTSLLFIRLIARAKINRI